MVKHGKGLRHWVWLQCCATKLPKTVRMRKLSRLVFTLFCSLETRPQFSGLEATCFAACANVFCCQSNLYVRRVAYTDTTMILYKHAVI